MVKSSYHFPSNTENNYQLGARTFGGLHNFYEFSILALTDRYHTRIRNTLLKGKIPPDPTSFLWEILPRTSKAPEPRYLLLFWSENIAPDNIIFS